MKVPLRWLQEFIDLPTSDLDELSFAFDMLGLTVEGIEEHKVDWSGVYVGRVVEIRPHPDADKIRVCLVDSGSGPEQIICGAWNFEEGAIVAVAKPGAVLPGDFEIGQRTIRGVESNGMICSERELNIGADQDGILVLDENLQIGSVFADVIEVPDYVFDLDVTPNRPDALSMVGVARDLGAYFGIEHHVPPLEMTSVVGETPITVEIADATGCRRFTAREIRDVTIATSPFRIRHRLHKVGVRSISNVVDVTNYVMFELGHPLHAFDADTIAGNNLVVRRAVAGETLVTLDGEKRSLSPDDLIIYDDEGPTSMSGTMGGARSEVSLDTTRVLMEAASWDPPTIMNMWRRHELRSEAATRFERGVDSNLADIANQRASAMVSLLTGGDVLDGAVDEIAIRIDPSVVQLTIHEVERQLGPGFTVEHVTDILQRLGMKVDGAEPMTVTVPTYRPDVFRPADLIEEVARIHGFDKFEATLPTGPRGGLTVEQKRQRRINETLSALGWDQAINLPFVGVEDLAKLGMTIDGGDLLTIKNPLRDEESKLRPTMLPGLLNSLRYNISHGASSVALFEVGRVFRAIPATDDPRLPEQIDRLAWAGIGTTGLAGLEGPSTEIDGSVSLALWRRLADVLGLDDVSVVSASPPGYHPGRTAAVAVDGVAIGFVGELAPSAARAFELDGRVAVAELDLPPLLSPVDAVLAHAPSVFPFVDFDLSFLVAVDTPVSDLVAVTTSAATQLVESARVFDEFKGVGEGRKALAIRYRLRASDRTLSNEEVAPVRKAMIEAAAAIGAELRGV